MSHTPGSNERPDWPLALVFGAGGLGMAVSRRLGLLHRVLIADRDAIHLEAQVAALRTAGYDAVGVQCDVTLADDFARVARVAASMGGLRSLAYVVGLSPALGDFSAIMHVNLVGAARALEVLEGVVVSGGAALLIASSAAHMQVSAQDIMTLMDDPLHADLIPELRVLLGADVTPAVAYALSKKALLRLCQRKANSWGQQGKRVVSLSPGLIATPQGAGEYRNSPGKMKLFESIPLRRECTMLEIADVAEFLLSHRASYINGVDLLVDGGLVASLGCRPFI